MRERSAPPGAQIAWIDLAQADYNPRLQQAIATKTVDFDILEMGAPFEGDVCGKGPSFGHNISHSHRRTKRRWNPNIQRVKALVGVAGVTPKRLNVCTSCLKAGKVKR